MWNDTIMEYVLGIEGGATRTTVIFADENNEILEKFSAGPANLRLMSSDDLEDHLWSIRKRIPIFPAAVGIGLAGARLAEDREVLRSTVARVWPEALCAPSDDLITALESVDWDDRCDAQVLVLSGTGSCCLGRKRDGSEVKLGGRGHILGDRASACHIAQHALRALMTIWDSENEWPDLGADILNFLQLKDPEALIDWSLVAPKTELASLAVVVFRAAQSRHDEIAEAVLEKAAATLAKDGANTAHRLGIDESQPVQFVLNGAVLLKNDHFRERVSTLILEKYPHAIFSPLERTSAWGALQMARRELQNPHAVRAIERQDPINDPITIAKVWRPEEASPTELRNPLSMNLSEMGITESIQLMLSEDAKIPHAILAEKEAIAWTIEKVIAAFNNGGRLLYAGAGTSGRLGVLDASECPPTFRVAASQVQGIIAGGRTALWSAAEGAEDDASAGKLSVGHRKVTAKDVVIGISASGYAPFIWGCLAEAKERGATTVLLTCHPGYKAHPLPDQVIAPNSGPEILTGSTRLKAGTATKLVLNTISTLAMTHTGKVTSNLMTDLNPSNIKLRGRAARIVSAISGADEEASRQALCETGWVVRKAIQQLAK